MQQAILQADWEAPIQSDPRIGTKESARMDRIDVRYTVA